MILEPQDWPTWLGENKGDPWELMRPADDGVLRLWPVSRVVNSAWNNEADLLDAIDDPACAAA